MVTHDPLCPYSQPCPVEWRNAEYVEAVTNADLCGQNNCAADAVAAIEALGGES